MVHFWKLRDLSNNRKTNIRQSFLLLIDHVGVAPTPPPSVCADAELPCSLPLSLTPSHAHCSSEYPTPHTCKKIINTTFLCWSYLVYESSLGIYTVHCPAIFCSYLKTKDGAGVAEQNKMAASLAFLEARRSNFASTVLISVRWKKGLFYWHFVK